MMLSIRMKTIACLASLLLCGCASVQRPEVTQGVEKQMILPAGAEQITERAHEKFMFPGAISAGAPPFPRVRAGDLDATICIELVVSTVGSVDSVRQIQPDDSCISPSDDLSGALFAAVDAAIHGWSFFAAGICTFDAAPAECDGPDAVIAPIPVKLAYAFRFKRSGSMVSVGKAAIRH